MFSTDTIFSLIFSIMVVEFTDVHPVDLGG
jgi:hypothetical protein